ncbi:MAG TPA: hypothetical protein VGF17_15315 [Phytomonospora sp.]
MAKLEMDPPFRHVRGRIGGLVYRRNRSGTAIAEARRADAPLKEGEAAVRAAFTAAAAYAKAAIADPVQGPRYIAAAELVGQRPYTFAVTDFLKEPVVQAIDTTGYRGVIGDAIKVRAVDDFEVTGVNVALSDGANAILKQGAAVLVDGLWHYAATTAIAVGTAVFIEAVATDRPGRTGSLQVPLVVA